MKPGKTVELMMRMMRDGKPCGVTGKTIAEVNAEGGLQIPKEFALIEDFPKEKPPNSEGMVLACITLEDGEELRLPDNETAPCGWGCGRTVQYRPGLPEWLVKACLYCLDERPLKGHS